LRRRVAGEQNQTDAGDERTVARWQTCHEILLKLEDDFGNTGARIFA
jgi:hypothetical protein